MAHQVLGRQAHGDRRAVCRNEGAGRGLHDHRREVAQRSHGVEHAAFRTPPSTSRKPRSKCVRCSSSRTSARATRSSAFATSGSAERGSSRERVASAMRAMPVKCWRDRSADSTSPRSTPRLRRRSCRRAARCARRGSLLLDVVQVLLARQQRAAAHLVGRRRACRLRGAAVPATRPSASAESASARPGRRSRTAPGARSSTRQCGPKRRSSRGQSSSSPQRMQQVRDVGAVVALALHDEGLGPDAFLRPACSLTGTPSTSAVDARARNQSSSTGAAPLPELKMRSTNVVAGMHLARASAERRELGLR